MKAMVLAAGLGTRLRPLTNTIPKPLLPVGGQPLIVWNLWLLRQHGIHEVIINLHYLGDLLEQALGDGTQWDLQIQYSREPVILGTGGGIKAVESFFEGSPFLVLNGDTLIDINLTEFIAWHESRMGLATMVVRDDPKIDQWGIVEVGPDSRIVSINGRGWSNDSPKPTVVLRMFAGVHLLHPRVLRHCSVGQSSSIIEAYVRELENGGKVMGYPVSGYWSDIGTPKRYAQAQRDAEEGRFPLASKLSRFPHHL